MMSVERRNLVKAYGARVELTSGKDGMTGAIRRAEELKREIPGSVILQQFENPANPQTHYLTTGKEIWEQTEGKIDIFVAGRGTRRRSWAQIRHRCPVSCADRWACR